MKICYKTTVGSLMHGLDIPGKSDEDIRYLTMPSLREVLSPFKNEELKVRDSKGDDVESWALIHFLKHLAQSNPTCYEVIKSPLYDKSYPLSDIIRSLMPYCFDGIKILMAHIGYAEAQLKRYLRPADFDFALNFEGESGHNITELWNENEYRRIPKATVAAYRVLAQCRQLLTTGDFQPVVKDYSADLHNKLMEIKTMDASEITAEFVTHNLGAIEGQIQDLKALHEGLPDCVKYAKPNIEKLEDILCDIYCV